MQAFKFYGALELLGWKLVFSRFARIRAMRKFFVPAVNWQIYKIRNFWVFYFIWQFYLLFLFYTYLYLLFSDVFPLPLKEKKYLWFYLFKWNLASSVVVITVLVLLRKLIFFHPRPYSSSYFSLVVKNNILINFVGGWGYYFHSYL